MQKFLEPGKIDPEILQEFFSSLPQEDSTILGPGIGMDAAVIRLGRNLIAVKTDPITFTSENLGWYAVNINANDIVCTGAIPRWFLATLLLPPGKDENSLRELFQNLLNVCRRMNISLIGGHTEVTPAVKKPLLVGQMIGEIEEGKLINNSGARVGDIILLTKGIAIEGTHIIYQEKHEDLESRIPSHILAAVKNFLEKPGISVVKEAQIASENVDIHCMHDPTEGGLMAGLWEIAAASEVGMMIEEKSIPVFEETDLLCRMYNLNPLSLLASGSLIIIVPPSDSDKLMNLYNRIGITCAQIGKVTPDRGVRIKKEDGIFHVSTAPKEELTKLFKEG